MNYAQASLFFLVRLAFYILSLDFILEYNETDDVCGNCIIMNIVCIIHFILIFVSVLVFLSNSWNSFYGLSLEVL